MSAIARTKQWNTFAQVWHLFDAKWQNPIESGVLLAKYLSGRYKPIHHPLNRNGDHVVVINTRDVALPGNEWRLRVYFHHTGYPGGASWTKAWELHDKDPTAVMRKAVYSALDGSLQRRYNMLQLHLYPDDDVPPEIMENVTNQIRPLRYVPPSLYTYSEEEVEKFPKIVDYPKNYVIR